MIPREHYRENDPWLAAVPLSGAGSSSGDSLLPGGTLAAGEALTSSDGRFSLLYQNDGNLVLSQSGAGTLWTSATAAPAGRLLLQADGDLVIDDGTVAVV